jgi:uncharacterized membrane protein YdjX (TVP38/TMEM64 family)
MKMTKRNKRILLGAIGAIMLAIVVGFSFNTFGFAVRMGLAALVPIVGLLFFISVIYSKEMLYKISIILVYFSLLILTVVTLIVKSGIMNEVSSAEDIVNIINDFGALGKLVFILIQFLQVTFIPIPSTIVTAAGAAIYSPFEALFLSTIGLIIGSLFAFFLGKTFGVRLVKWIVGEEALNKYYKFIKGKDKAMLIYMFIFPAFPDDVLCLFAGLTTMGYVSFIIVQLISRPLNVAITVFFVDNIAKVPFSGVGLLIWAGIAIVFIGSMVVMWKYAAKLEFYMLKGIGKLLGRPLIKDIDLIVAEEFLSKRKKRVVEQPPEEQETEPLAEIIEEILPEVIEQEVLAASDIPPEVTELAIDTRALDKDISTLMKKKIRPIRF